MIVMSAVPVNVASTPDAAPPVTVPSSCSVPPDPEKSAIRPFVMSSSTIPSWIDTIPPSLLSGSWMTRSPPLLHFEDTLVNDRVAGVDDDRKVRGSPRRSLRRRRSLAH